MPQKSVQELNVHQAGFLLISVDLNENDTEV